MQFKIDSPLNKHVEDISEYVQDMIDCGHHVSISRQYKISYEDRLFYSPIQVLSRMKDTSVDMVRLVYVVSVSFVSRSPQDVVAVTEMMSSAISRIKNQMRKNVRWGSDTCLLDYGIITPGLHGRQLDNSKYDNTSFNVPLTYQNTSITLSLSIEYTDITINTLQLYSDIISEDYKLDTSDKRVYYIPVGNPPVRCSVRSRIRQVSEVIGHTILMLSMGVFGIRKF